MAEKIGFIGTGIMGAPMARNLMEDGYELVLFNRTTEKAEEVAGDGATVVGNPREVAESCDVVVLMLPDSPQVEEIVEGEDGVLEGLKEGALIVDMSTISPVVTRELAEKIEERGASMLDAPVSGGEPGAQQGTLAIMVGGGEEDFERARPLLEVIGDAITHVGPTGAGQTAKAANQIVVAVTLEGISEALVLASKAGVAPEKILEAISGGLAGSNVMEAKKENFLEHDFEPGFRVDLNHKDLWIALSTGREYGVSLPVTAILDQMLESLKTKGRGDRDHSAILTLIEDQAQHELGDRVG